MDPPTASKKREKQKLPEELQLAGTLANLANLALSIYFFFSYQGPVNWLGVLGLAAPISFLVCLAGFAGLIQCVILVVYRISPRYREVRAGRLRGDALEVDASEHEGRREGAGVPEGSSSAHRSAAHVSPSVGAVGAGDATGGRSSPFKWRVVRLVGLATFFGAIIVPSIAAFLDAPPFLWMCELQTALFRGYSSFASWLLTSFAWAVIGLALLWVLDPKAILATGPMPGRKSLPTRPGRVHAPRRFEGTVVVGIVGGVCLFLLAASTGIYSIIQGKRISTTVAELQAGHKPGSHWLEVEGIPLPESRVGVGEKTVVVPLVTRGWETAEPIEVFLRMDEKDYNHKIWPAGAGKFEGLVSMFDVGGEARSGLAHQRKLIAGPHSYVIDLDETPAFWGDFSKLMWGLTAAFLAVAGIFRVAGSALPPTKRHGH